jgi:trigger factor
MGQRSWTDFNRKTTVSPTETSSSTKREVQIEIAVEEVTRETEAIIRKYQQLARIPGFRRGHVPASVIRQRFAEDIRTQLVDTLVPRYFRQEMHKQGLVPVSEPQVTDLHVQEGEPLRFKANFEVLPQIKVAGYKELRAAKPDISVSDEEVEESLKNLQEQQATFVSVEDRTLADKDFAQVSLDGKPEDGQGQPVHMDDLLVEIGGSNTMPEFTENLRGRSVGDEPSFPVTYPGDFSDPRLAGKTILYTLKVGAIKRKNLPELNDQFAKELGDFASLDEVRRRLRENIEAERRRHAERAAKDRLIEELIKRNDFELPEALVERQVDLRLERGRRALMAQGVKAEDLKKIDLNRLRAAERERARQEVKGSLLLDKIAEEENIQVDEEEINREVEALATQARQSPDAIRARLTREGVLDRIRDRIRNEKTLDFLYRQSA